MFTRRIGMQSVRDRGSYRMFYHYNTFRIQNVHSIPLNLSLSPVRLRSPVDFLIFGFFRIFRRATSLIGLIHFLNRFISCLVCSQSVFFRLFLAVDAESSKENEAWNSVRVSNEKNHFFFLLPFAGL